MMLFGDYGNFMDVKGEKHKGALPFIVSAVNGKHPSILYRGGKGNPQRMKHQMNCGK